jgi:hypothetical protein
MKFVVYYESFYMCDEIVTEYNTLRYHKSNSIWWALKKRFSTLPWKIISLLRANISAVGQQIYQLFWPRRVQAVFTMTSLPYSEYSFQAHPNIILSVMSKLPKKSLPFSLSR